MNGNQYRIKVEQRPDENFKRYYPEIREWMGRTVYHTWKSTTPVGDIIQWYKIPEEAEKHIDNLIKGDSALNDKYVIELIKYPKTN